MSSRARVSHPIRKRSRVKALGKVLPITGSESAVDDLGRPERDALDALARLAEATLALDRSGRIIYWNDGATTLLGWRSEEALGRSCHQLLSGDDPFGNRYCGPSCPIVAATIAGAEPAPFFMDVMSSDGSRVKVRVRTAALPNAGPSFKALVHLLDRGDEGRIDATLADLRAWTEGEEPSVRLQVVEPVEPSDPFTQREREILVALSNGYSALNLSARLAVSHATVRNHIQNILRRLEVHSQVEAVSVAFRRGWL
jgi:DNA-binding CsgD family transcriptional regulator/PAS domain-containing protein